MGYFKLNDNSCKYYEDIFSLLADGIKLKKLKIINNDFNDNDFYITDDSLDYPIVYTRGNLYINRFYYELNKKIIIDIIRKEILESNSSYLHIHKKEYSFNFIKELIETRNIYKLYLIDIKLDMRELYYLKSKKIDIYTVSNGVVRQVSTSCALGDKSFSEVINSSRLDFNSNIEYSQIKNLKYVKDNTIIDYSSPFCNYKSYSDDYMKIFKIINTLELLGKKCKFVFSVDKKELFPYALFTGLNLKFVEVIIYGDNSYYTLEEFIYENNLTGIMTIDIKNSDLSPLEKFMAVYKIVTSLKEYNENDDDLEASRLLKYILNNEYMVCCGFQSLLTELLRQVGIESVSFDVTVKDFSDNSEEDHERAIVHIVDEKYDVNGYFVSDPTWDNNLERDSVIFSLNTFEETNKEMMMTYLTLEDVFFNNSDELEFDKKLKKYLDVKISEINNSSMVFNDGLDNVLEVYNEVLIDIMSVLYKLDYNKFISVISRYNTDKCNNIILDNVFEYEELFKELNSYFMSKTKQKVTREMIINTILEYRKTLFNDSEEELFRLRESILNYNIKRKEFYFPYEFDSENKHKLIKKLYN